MNVCALLVPLWRPRRSTHTGTRELPNPGAVWNDPNRRTGAIACHFRLSPGAVCGMTRTAAPALQHAPPDLLLALLPERTPGAGADGLVVVPYTGRAGNDADERVFVVDEPVPLYVPVRSGFRTS